MYQRPSWDEYFMAICDTVGTRATCNRGRSGCVITKDNRLLVTGYVGSPHGLPHCDDVGHLFEQDRNGIDHCVRTVHAEQNAIAQAARMGVAINGGTMYVRMTPCRSCACLLIAAGIVRVVVKNKHVTPGAGELMLLSAGIILDYFSLDTVKYESNS